MAAIVNTTNPNITANGIPVIHVCPPAPSETLNCPSCARKITIARPFTKPNITGYGIMRINLPHRNRPTLICIRPINTTVANKYSTPWSTTNDTITTAKAPVAPEIMPGRPPNTAVISPTIKAEYSPTNGCTCATKAKATASGTRANATVSPDKISVFPLSNFIFFPNTNVPLNIFEPRYIEMINDSMKSSRLIGMVQPKKNTGGSTDGLYDIGCLGKITSFSETEDGRYLIVLNGLSRFKIVEEIKNDKLYRECKISFEEFENDTNTNKEDIKFSDLKLIFKDFKSFFEKRGFAINWNELEKQSLEQTINALAMASPFSLEEKQILLETKNLSLRKDKLEEILKTYVLDNFENSTLQ